MLWARRCLAAVMLLMGATTSWALLSHSYSLANFVQQSELIVLGTLGNETYSVTWESEPRDSLSKRFRLPYFPVHTAIFRRLKVQGTWMGQPPNSDTLWIATSESGMPHVSGDLTPPAEPGGQYVLFLKRRTAGALAGRWVWAYPSAMQVQ